MQQTRLLKAVLFASALTLGTSGLALAAPAQTSTLDTAVSSHFMAADSMAGTFYREDDLFVQAVSKRVVQTAAIADTVDQSAYVMTAAGALYQIADLELEVNDPAAGLAEQTLNADAFYVSALG